MIPPRWMYRLLWAFHGAVDRVSGGRLSTTEPRGGRLGVLYLETTGRRSGRPRRNALNFVRDGASMVVIASNAGAATHPAWWHNLQAQPVATVRIGGRSRRVRARPATPDEAERSWARFIAASGQYATYRSATDREIPAIILEPDD